MCSIRDHPRWGASPVIQQIDHKSDPVSLLDARCRLKEVGCTVCNTAASSCPTITTATLHERSGRVNDQTQQVVSCQALPPGEPVFTRAASICAAVLPVIASHGAVARSALSFRFCTPDAVNGKWVSGDKLGVGSTLPNACSPPNHVLLLLKARVHELLQGTACINEF